MKQPVYIDLHTHGFGRYDTRTADPEDILKISRLHGRSGTSAILPTIYPGPIGAIRMNMDAVKLAMEAQSVRAGRVQPGESGPAKILGVHLEGPFLNPVRCGALDRDSFLKPSRYALWSLIGGYEEIVRLITIAPELPGALHVIEECAAAGIHVNLGHSDATYSQGMAAKQAGATGITHLFNAMRPFHHREPGLAGLGLLDPDLYIEVIADGFHLHAETLRLIFAVKPHDRILLVSDSVCGSRGDGKPVRTEGGVLAGSGTTMAGSAAFLRGMGVSGQVIRLAASRNPLHRLDKKKSL